MRLEILSRPARGCRRPVPLLFVHGAFVGAWCWAEHWLPWFAEQGYDAHAVSLRGHGASAGREALDAATLDDYVADVLLAASTLDSPPVLIGHSMGAVVVQRAARRAAAPAMVLIAPIPPHGLTGSLLTFALRDPGLFFALNAMQLGAGNGPALRRMRSFLFSTSMSEAEVTRFLWRTQRESQRALLDLAWPQHPWIRPSVGLPTLVVGAEGDALFSTAMIQEAAYFHRVVPKIFPAMAHTIMLEPGWQDVASHVLQWLAERESGGECAA
jgi:pimeloyl-ACP methyl ester carboxylesterase